jgi:hypothetical protein
LKFRSRHLERHDAAFPEGGPEGCGDGRAVRRAVAEQILSPAAKPAARAAHASARPADLGSRPRKAHPGGSPLIARDGVEMHGGVLDFAMLTARVRRAVFVERGPAARRASICAKIGPSRRAKSLLVTSNSTKVTITDEGSA